MVDGASDVVAPRVGHGSGRRRFLGALALAALGTGAVGGAMVEDVLPGGVRVRRALGLTGDDGTVPDVRPGPVRTETRHSAARGRDVRLVVIDPPGGGGSALPVCLALHGRGSSAEGFLGLGLPQFLAAAVAAGVPPFRVVAVDGGDATYWHPRGGDDPMRLLTTELPGWIAEFGLPAPSRALGISMGGSGALQYARARGGLAATALLSPALFRSWPDARTVDAYQDEADWRAHEPLQHLDALPGAGRTAVWCGTEDPFCPAARELAGHVAETHFPRGEHTDGFWRRVLPAALELVGRA
ncbi:alpha/beta hydrolase-fold protein [Kitasatospora sp. NPDC049285]|uniref:alpha/beta hydrolase n=1 Tax=Kitasatospora sp. NPDC049285 TaxID=3157096 RepID=UPI00342B7FAD